MSVHSSSIADLSLLPPHLSSSNFSLNPLNNTCFASKTSIFIFSAFTIINLLLLPLFIFVLCLGYQQGRQERTRATMASRHSDLFIHHSITMQLIVFLALTCFFCGGYISLPDMMQGGLYIWTMTAFGQALFHILTCVERYLAVVHPITYMGVTYASGVRIRNISIGCVWLLSFGWMAVCYLTSSMLYLIFYCCCMALFLIVISVCSISVLCTLQCSGPGEVGGNKEQVDQSKKRVFSTIIAIMIVLLFRFGGHLIGVLVYNSDMVSSSNSCLVVLSAFWVDLPSSLVLPLLFLRRTEKLQCCRQNSESV